MNLKSLSSGSMLSVTGGWKADEEIRTGLTSTPVGAALFGAVEVAHDDMAAQLSRRLSVNSVLGGLTEDLTGADRRFDGKTRAAYFGLAALAESTDDPLRAAYLRKLKAILFPRGLQVTRLSYREEVGVTIELRQIATPALMAELAAIPLGDRTMADVLGAMLQAGEELGQKLRERDQVLESLTRNGTATSEIDPRGSRNRWIRAVRALLASLDLIELSDALREKLLAPLKRAVAQASRARGGQVESEGEGEDSAGDAEEDIGEEIEEAGAEPDLADSEIEADGAAASL